jgi:hypothetical protein
MSDFMETMPLGQKIVLITNKEIEQMWEDSKLKEDLRKIAKATEEDPYVALSMLLALAQGKINLRKYDWNKEQETFAHGYKIGYDLAYHNGDDIIASIELMPYEIDDSSSFWEALNEAQSNFESFSPWEHFAKDLNDSKDSEELWEAYRNGISEGMRLWVTEQEEEWDANS